MTKEQVRGRLRELLMTTPMNNLESEIDKEAQYIASQFEFLVLEARAAFVAAGLIVFIMAMVFFW